MGQPTLKIRFANDPEQKFDLTIEQAASFKKLWDEAPDDLYAGKPAIAVVLDTVEPTLGAKFLAAGSGKLSTRSGRLFGAVQGFSWQAPEETKSGD